MKAYFLLAFWVQLSVNLTSRVVSGQIVSCYAGDNCSGGTFDGSASFDLCCLELGAQSYISSSGECLDCSSTRVEFGDVSYSIDEGENVVNLVMVRYSNSSSELVVSVTLTEGSARGGFDYGYFPEEEITFTTVFLVNETSMKFGVRILNDNIVEATETFTASLSMPSDETIQQLGYDISPNPDSLQIGRRGNTVVSIIDNDFVNITLSPDFVEQGESEAHIPIDFTVRKTGLAERAVEVIILTRNISFHAVDGQDYMGLRATVLRFEPNDIEKSRRIHLIDDSVVEYTEEFQVVILPGVNETGVKFPRGQRSTVQILDDNDFVRLRFASLSYTVREEQGTIEPTITQEGDSERPIAFRAVYNRNATTATSGVDFRFAESIMSTQMPITGRILASGETLSIGPVEVFEEGRYEVDEMIQLELFPAEGEMALQTGDPATIVLQDSDEVRVGFVEGETVVSEPSTFIVPVVLFENNLDPGTSVDLIITAVDGVATGDVDYSFSFDSSLFGFSPDGESTLNVSVDIIDDDVFEGREDFTFTLSSPQPRVVFNTDLTVAITDNEDLLIDFDMDIYDVNETDGMFLIEVELTSRIEREIQLLLVTEDGKATGGEDYESISEVLTFRPDSRINRVEIILYDDDLNEGLEDFTLQLVLTDERLGIPDVLRESTVRIFDDEVTFVEFSSESYTVSEQERFVVLVINKTGVTQEDVPVIVNLMDDSAKAGDALDYGPFNSRSLSLMARLLADEVAVPFGVVIREDKRVENEESFTAQLSLPETDGSNVKLGAMTKTTIFIKDNDKINVTIFPEFHGVEESNTTLMFAVSRDDNLILDRNVFVSVSVEVDNAEEGDFKAEEMLLTFSESGARSFPYPVEIFEDAIAEGTEWLTVRLLAPPGETGVTFHRDSARISIIDDDVSKVQFSQNLFQGDEIDGSVEICLSKDLETESGFVVNLTAQETTPNPPETFRARADIDFDSTPVLVTFAPKEKVACGNVVIKDDNQLGESREVFAVVFGLPQDAPYIGFGSVRMATVEVSDTPDVLFGFERTELQVSEAAGNFEICVVVFNPGDSDALEATISFMIVSRPGTADFSDYQIVGGDTGTLNNSTRETCFAVQVTDDLLFENEIETFSIDLELLDVIGMTEDGRRLRVLNRPRSINISIADDDRDIVIGFEQEEFTAFEGDTALELCVVVVRPTFSEDLNATINITVATVSGTAGPSDYIAISAINRDTVLVFNNATRRNCFVVTITEDSIFEGLERFTVQLTPRVVNAPRRVSLSPSAAGITIIDNENQTRVRFEEGSSSRRVQENEGTISLCVEAFGGGGTTPQFDVSVDFVSGTAAPQLDFILEPGLTLSFDALTRRRCFDVVIVADGEEDEEFFSVALSLIQFLPGLSVDPARGTAVITIVPAEPPVLGNDTVIGDPLFTVPLNIQNGFDLLPPHAKRLDGFPNLCYEIHGEHDRHFNLVSDTCATVNAHYVASDSPDLPGLNVISTIGVRAVNQLNICVNIEVGVENGCVPVISEDNVSSRVLFRYQSAGIAVSKHRNQVRVSVPNCKNIQLVMWITCQNISGASMIRYDITRGINLRPTSHGLIGQFWNVPISINRYTYTGSQMIDYLDLDSLYAVTVSSPLEEQEARTFIAEFYTFTWEPRNEVCFYAGNIQGGRLAEITDENFNDPVIEGSYEEYVVGGLFEHEFVYSQFSDGMC